MSKEKKGRPYKYGEPLIPVTFRIPESKVKQANEYVAQLKAEVLNKLKAS